RGLYDKLLASGNPRRGDFMQTARLSAWHFAPTEPEGEYLPASRPRAQRATVAVGPPRGLFDETHHALRDADRVSGDLLEVIGDHPEPHRRSGGRLTCSPHR